MSIQTHYLAPQSFTRCHKTYFIISNTSPTVNTWEIYSKRSMSQYGQCTQCKYAPLSVLYNHNGCFITSIISCYVGAILGPHDKSRMLIPQTLILANPWDKWKASMKQAYSTSHLNRQHLSNQKDNMLRRYYCN